MLASSKINPRFLSAKLFVIALWALLIGVSLSIRPLFPVDETRYVTVAWEMWLRGDFLVPHLNGETYSHKPPLLFWLMQLGWWLFGVNDWTPRLVAPLFGLAAVLLCARVARLLWPEHENAARIAPLLLLGCGFWAAYGTLTMFDTPLAFFVLLGIYGIASAMRSVRTYTAWVWFGLAIGGGVLIKGPVILLHLLPAALLAPWWWDRQIAEPHWRAWYLGILASVLIGAAIALSWAIPAGIAGGEAYRNAIFWGQTSGRVADSFAHRLPWWWYCKSLPLLLLPWLLWTPFWSVFRPLGLADRGVRFCLAWAVPVFIAFSLISGKRLHYLLPLFPALALLLGRAAGSMQKENWRGAHLPLVAVVMLAGLAMALFPLLNRHYHWRDELLGISPLWGVLLAATALAGLIVPAKNALQSSMQVCALSIATLLLGSSAYLSEMGANYDLKPAAERIAALLRANRPVAHFGKYHGQFHFLGRIDRPLPVLKSPGELLKWAQAQPDGYVIVTYKNHAEAINPLAEYRYSFKGRQLALLSCRILSQHPEILKLL